MPQVVNRHHFRTVVGPGSRRPREDDTRPELPEPWVYIGRGTALGNPWRVGVDGSPEQVLQKYRRHLFERLRERDPAVMTAMRQIVESTSLVCSCAPRPCHGHVVVRAWSWLRSTGAM